MFAVNKQPSSPQQGGREKQSPLFEGDGASNPLFSMSSRGKRTPSPDKSMREERNDQIINIKTSPSGKQTSGKSSPKRHQEKQWHSGQKKMATKRAYRRFKDYKYPTGINDDAMAFLNDDLDDILAYADEKARKEAAAVAEDACGPNSNTAPQRKK